MLCELLGSLSGQVLLPCLVSRQPALVAIRCRGGLREGRF